ncbi:unnamed protein product [Pleuronectes platessa]|uniref:Uncharacterized protein n=1 Tax=Pleuronectes platessa TaxID=8262 RepID=A0A9N7V4X9_PLEPL|nr:unnamed protein product [Pleuronectes platessa]
MAFCFMCPAAGTGTDGNGSVLQETGVCSQKKTDRGETEGEEQRGGVVGPQGCSERSPQFFHHCCRHRPGGGGAASEPGQGDSVRQGEEERERWRSESKRGTVWGAVSLVDDL